MGKKVEINVTTRGVGETNKAIARVGTKFDKLKNSVNRVAIKMRGLKSAFKKMSIAGGVVAAGMAILIKKTLSLVDEQAKLSRNIGVSTEALAAFGLVAELGGTSSEKMNKSLGKMIKNIGDASLGFGTAKTIFEKFGIDVKQLAALKPEEQFMRMADAIRGMASRTEKVSFATAVFGRQGIDLIGILEDGSDAFQAAAKDTQLFGTAISRVESKKIEDFNDQVTRLTEAGKGLAIGFTQEFVEHMRPVIDKLVDGAREANGFKEEIEGIAKFSGQTIELGIAFTKGTASVINKITEIRDFFDKHPIVKQAFQHTAPGTSLLLTRNDSSGVDAKKKVGENNGSDRVKDIKDSEVARKKAAKDREADRKQLVLDREKLEKTKTHNNLLKAGESLTNTLRSPQEKLNALLKRYNDLRDAGAISTETYQRAVKSATEDFKDATQASAQIGIAGTQSLTKMQETMKDVSQSMKGELADFLHEGQFTFESFRKSAVNIASVIKRKFREKAADDIFALFSNKGVTKGNQAVEQFAQDFNQKTKRMFETFIDDKHEMDRQFEDNLKGLGNFVGNTADGMRANMANGFFKPTGNAFTRLASHARSSMANMADSVGSLQGVMGGVMGGGGGQKKEEPSTFSKIAGIAMKVLPFILHDGGPVKNAPRMKLPSFHTGGEVAAILRNDEYVVSPQGTKAAGINRLNKINKGDMSDFGGGGGRGVNITVMAPITLNAIDAQSGVAFLSQPENIEVFESAIRQALAENGGSDLGL